MAQSVGSRFSLAGGSTSTNAPNQQAGARKCLVTGGTRGIGRAIVDEFVGLGAQVFLCARSATDVDAAVRELSDKGYKVYGCAADIAKPEQRQELLQQVSSAFGGELHVLVCNAGTNTQLPTLQYTKEDYDRIMGTNLEATYALCQVMQPLLVAGAGWQQQQQPGASGSSSSLPDPIARAGATPEGDACIIFISSVAGGPLAGRSGSLYAASKAGLNHLAASFACEWAAQGIRVNSVAPWVTLTELGQQNLKDPAAVDRLLSRTPLGRLAQPQDVSGIVAFLASPAAAFITGQTIAVDGGYSVMGFW